ncbi:helix-turn-helix domain-containing protein [Sphingomonas bacterium]|uniref:helix-turn-helix domain-containing protein n=1 Tax=Sphingomonas bacterium TaxID=1895847 RepID=UPI001576384C|nr:helix-turn-helix transcriptional regulator [Sphingomonas bacterium]
MKQLVRTAKQMGEAIARERRSRGLTQGQLAEMAGLRQEAISKIESGNPATRFGRITDILAALDLELTMGSRTKSTSQDIESIF